MRFTFLVIGALSFAALAVWIALYSVQPDSAVEIVGKRFTEPSFSQRANAQLTAAEAMRDAVSNTYKRWNLIGHIAGWIALAATSIVTITAGVLGKSESESPPPKRTPRMYIIGGLSALASAATLAGNYAEETAQAARSDAVEIAQAIRATAEQLKADPAKESALLSDLDATIKIRGQ